MRGVLALALRTTEFLFYHLLLTLVDRVSRLPREAPMPEAMRLYRENIALKAQVEVLAQHIARIEKKKPRHTVGARAAQVFAYFLTRGNEPFQRYYLSASLATLRRWAARFLRRRWTRRGGRPPVDAKVVEIILTLKRECPLWGQRRIHEELRRMGIRISQPTIQRILREHDFSPFPGRKIDFERVRSAAKDAVWAVDFFAVKTTKGVWLPALVVIDLYTRELLELRVHDGWDVDAACTARVVGLLLRRTKRKPAKLVHDHGPHFLGAFSRALPSSTSRRSSRRRACPP